MDIVCYRSFTNSIAHSFACALNAAYRLRSEQSSKIPYEAISAESLQYELLCDDCFSLVAYDQAFLFGGIFISFKTIDGIKTAIISHLFSHPSHQRKGIAKQLLLKAEVIASDAGCRIMCLNVGHIIQPAVSLYHNLGYKPLRIYACEPNTFHFIRMIKSLPPFHFSEGKRKICLLVSKLKFYLLFRSDSTPRIYQKAILKLLRK